LHLKPLDAAGALAALRARKERLERFHEVNFSDEALECAVQRADSYLKDKLLPAKALELLDASGAAVKLRQGARPQEVTETMMKMKFIELRIESSIAAHEFEKVKLYQDEERKERENLATLQKKYGLENTAAGAVSLEDVEQIIAQWAAYPYTE